MLVMIFYTNRQNKALETDGYNATKFVACL